MKKAPFPETVPPFLRDTRYGSLDWVLDEEPGWVLRKAIPILSANVRIDPDAVHRIRQVARMGPVVYALKYRGLYDLHFLRARLAEMSLPLPAFVFGLSTATSGSLGKLFRVFRAGAASMVRPRRDGVPKEKEVLKEILEKGGAGVIFLADEEVFRNRYLNPEKDPIRLLLDVQGSLAGSISIIPLFILYDRRPRRAIRPFWESFLGDPDRPGPLKRILISTRRWAVPELLVGEPVHLVGEFEEFGSDKSWEDLPFEIRTELLANINARIRAGRGPEKLTRTEIKERVLRDEEVRAAVEEKAAKKGVSVKKVRKKAEAYVEEIAADQRIQVIHFFYHLLKWIFSHIFDGIDVREEQFATLKKTNEKGSIIFVPCHKSHFDYLVMPYFTFTRQMPVPLIAAGKNLSFWPLGPLLRHAAAFFLRRSFKGLDLYTKVFASYIKVLVCEGFNIKFFMEGGRSRTGKLLAPKLGMLGFLLKTVQEGSVEDLTFIPSFVGYEQIPEEKSYLRELSGFDKKKESIGSIIRARKILRRRYGKVYLRFDKPVSFIDFCKQWKGGVDPGDPSIRGNAGLAHDFAYHLMAGIVRVGVITPVDLAAGALVCAGDEQVSHSIFLDAAICLKLAVESRGFELADTLVDGEKSFTATLGLFTERGFIEPTTGDSAGETAYVINRHKRINLEFYKNSLVNYLWPMSLVAVALLSCESVDGCTRESLSTDFRRLRLILSREIIADPLVTDDLLIGEALSFFADRGWVEEGGNGELRLLHPRKLEYLKGIVDDILEAYYLVLCAADESIEGMSLKEFARHVAQSAPGPKAGEGEAELPAAVAPVTVRTALARLNELSIVEFDQRGKVIRKVMDPSGRNRWRERLARATGRRVHSGARGE